MLMFMINTLVTDFIYTADQVNLTSCYTTETSILYNRNVNRIQLTLVSQNNTNCSVLPKGVEAQIAFQTSGIPIQRISITNFTYENTTTLIFENVPEIISEEFAVLNIYSYGYITEVPIFVFREQRSSLSQCFEPASVVDISETQIKVSLKPTLLCTNQFNTLSSGTPPVVIAELQSATLNLQGEVLNLPVKTFQDDYKKGDLIEITLPLTPEQSETLLLIVAPNATISFKSSQGGTIVEFLHSVGSVTTTGWAVGDTIFWDKTQRPQLGLFQNMYMLRLQISKDFHLLKPLMDTLVFDNVMYRITGLAPNITNAQQITVQTTKFDIDYRFLTFKCDQGKIEDRIQCQNFYTTANNPNINSSIYLDIIFQKGSKYVHIEKKQVETQAQDVMYVIASVGHKKSSLQIVSQSLPILPQPMLMKIKYTVIQNSDPISFNDPSRSFVVEKVISSFFQIVEFDCDEKCYKLMTLVKNDPEIFYEIQSNIMPGVLFGRITTSSDYRIVQGIIIALGLIIIVILSITSIIQIVLLLRQIKAQSKKKSKKNQK